MMRGYGYAHWCHGHCGCGCHEGPSWYGYGRGPAWGWQAPATKDEVVEDMETYKAELEAEITALEKRINAMKEKK
jgi:hypothetical protein